MGVGTGGNWEASALLLGQKAIEVAKPIRRLLSRWRPAALSLMIGLLHRLVHRFIADGRQAAPPATIKEFTLTP